MRRFISLLTALLFVLAAVAQKKSTPLASAVKQTDTIFARFSMCGTIRGDTVMFDDRWKGDALTGYFFRNVRCVEEGNSHITGVYKFYFIINTEGRVTNVWCDTATPDGINKEITRVVTKMFKVIPTTVKGKYVVTVVETGILFEADDQDIEKSNYYDIDLPIHCSPICIKPALQHVKKE